MWKHLRRAAMIGGVVGSLLLWSSTNSIPSVFSAADGLLTTNLKWIGWENPPPDLASAVADNRAKALAIVLIVLAVIAVLSWAWDKIVTKSRKPPVEPNVFRGVVRDGGFWAYNKFEGANGFDLQMAGKSGVFSSNIVTGFNDVRLSDKGEHSQIHQNAFARGEVSPWDLPKYNDGSSSLWRMIHIVEMLLAEWKQQTGREYANKKALMDAARTFVNSRLASAGEDWMVDDDLQTRLGYGDSVSQSRPIE